MLPPRPPGALHGRPPRPLFRRRPPQPFRGRPGNPLRSTTTALTAVAIASVLTLSGCLPLPDWGSDEPPITVMTWAPENTKATNMPGMPAMGQAYARWVNATGGIDGRRLRVLTCNERNDTVRAARCAERARKEGAVAVVGSYSQHGRSFMSSLEADGIPYLGGYGISGEEFTSPLSYPVNGGQAALLAGNGRQLSSACDRVSLVRPDTIAGDRMPRFLNAGLRVGEGTSRAEALDIPAREDATEYSKAAQRALLAAAPHPSHGGTGRSCVTAVLEGRTETFFDSFRRLQKGTPKMLVASVQGSVSQPTVDRTGAGKSPLEGAYLTGWYPVPSDQRWLPMEKVVQQYAFGDDRINTADPGVQTTWIAYTVLRSVLESLDGQPITRKSVQRQLDSGEPVGTGGLTPPLSWGYDDLLAAHDYPRLVNSMVTYQKVQKGRLVTVRRGFVDTSSTLEDSSA